MRRRLGLVANHFMCSPRSTSRWENARSPQGRCNNVWKYLNKWKLLNASREWQGRCHQRQVFFTSSSLQRHTPRVQPVYSSRFAWVAARVASRPLSRSWPMLCRCSGRSTYDASRTARLVFPSLPRIVLHHRGPCNTANRNALLPHALCHRAVFICCDIDCTVRYTLHFPGFSYHRRRGVGIVDIDCRFVRLAGTA